MTLAQQHRYERLAASLILVGTFVTTTINYFVRKGFWNPALSHRGLITLIVRQPLFLWMLYGIYKGRRWAKILYIVLTGTGILFFLFAYLFDHKRMVAIGYSSPGAAVSSIVGNLFSLAVLVPVVLSLRRPTLEPTVGD